MGDNNRNLKKMLKRFKPDGFDWMNFVLTRRNPFTFHHIEPRSEGGSDTIENGAILTRRAHDLLHLLEYVCPDAYDDLQDIFARINASKGPLTDDIIEEIDDIMYMIFNKEHYAFKIDVDLSYYRDFYYNGVRRDRPKAKRLRK